MDERVRANERVQERKWEESNHKRKGYERKSRKGLSMICVHVCLQKKKVGMSLIRL